MIKRGMYGKGADISLMVDAGGYVVNGGWRLIERDGVLVVERTGAILDLDWLCDWPRDAAVGDYNELINEASRRLTGGAT